MNVERLREAEVRILRALDRSDGNELPRSRIRHVFYSRDRPSIDELDELRDWLLSAGVIEVSRFPTDGRHGERWKLCHQATGELLR